MHNQQAFQLAQTLCDTTERVLLPIIPVWAERHSRGRNLNYRAPEIRVGSGRATHHRFDPRNGHHSITFGAKMVADKLEPEACASWLSTREILQRDYFGGQVSVANLLAHTACHEFAHFLQTVCGARRRGSVHNAVFYGILDDLHNAGIAAAVRRSLLELAGERGQTLSSEAVPMPEPGDALANFRPGDTVRFGRDKELQGRITRINRKTCSVQGTGPCRGRFYRVHPQGLVPHTAL